jgi:Flp pilus assembly protein TadG
MSSRIRQFVSDRRGNFALISAVLAVPLILVAGVALDVANITRTKTELQNALDAAVLAIAREGKQVDDKQAVAIANTFLENNYGIRYADLKVVRDGTMVKLDASAKADMAFGGLFGYDDWKVATSSTADIAYMNYEIALSLDTTGSMAGGKLASLKDAVIGMVDAMSVQVGDPKKLKFAMVPFATFVNVGPQYGPAFKSNGKIQKNTGASWLDLKGDVEVPQLELKKGVSRFEVFHNLGEEWKGCVETRMPTSKKAYDVDDVAATTKDKDSLFVPAFSIDEPDSGYPNSYIDSAVNPLDKNAAKAKLGKYGIQTGTSLLSDLVSDLIDLIPIAIEHNAGTGPNRGCDMQPITPLTSDYNLIKTRVNQLQAAGTTNIMEGVAWGHRVLSPDEPFAEGAPAANDLRKIMIVLTDGANNFGNNNTALGSEYSSFGYLVDGRLAQGGSSSTTDAMNVKTLAACEAAKKGGIEVYTIRLEEPDVATGTMLKDCASGADHYFDAPSRSQLDEVIQQIKEKIVVLRLAS